MTRALAFLSAQRRPDFGTRLARLRWRRAAAAETVIEMPRESPARALDAAAAWVLVASGEAIPTGPIPEPPPGGVVVGRVAGFAEGACAHTLRELGGQALDIGGGPALAVAVRTPDIGARDNETVEEAFRRLSTDDGRFAASFGVYAFPDPSDRERPEVSRHLPTGPLRVLDAGCGSGGLALARARNPAWEVTGIEKDPILAARARTRCTRILEGDLIEVLPRLSAEGERFDAVVFADVLEHLEDPIGALAQARRLTAGEGLAVVSVPNAGHASIGRDLLLGRFDPVPSGLCDAGHLRWFTRESLRDALEESGWRVETLEPEAGAPAPDAGAFFRLAEAWPDCDRESLATYQWIATARAR